MKRRILEAALRTVNRALLKATQDERPRILAQLKRIQYAASQID